jgi:hypothetical protein
MVDPILVNAIWPLIHSEMLAIQGMGNQRITTSAVVDRVVGRCIRELPALSREVVLEAWLYLLMHKLADRVGVKPADEQN